MKRINRAPAMVAIVGAVLMASCRERPQGAPTSARQPVEPSTAGLLNLFVRECLEQRDLQWAKQESRRIAATCSGLFVGDGEAGDCEQSVAGDVSWLVPTSGGGTVLVQMSWIPEAPVAEGETRTKVRCSLSTSADLAKTLKQVGQGASLGGEPIQDERQSLQWDGPGGRLFLSSRAPQADDGRMDRQGQWARQLENLERNHPYELQFDPDSPAQ